MKKNKLLLGFCISVSMTACGQSVKESAVPAAVKQAVEKQYPGIKAKWEKEDGNYEANLKKDGKSISLLINDAGTILESEIDITASELPAAITAYMQQHYTGKKFLETAKITDKNNVTTYEVAIKGKDVMFDSNGVFLKEIED